MKKLKIAMMGIKGIPAKWGGMEKYVEEVGKRLVQRGHKVTVFGSRWYCGHYGKADYQGIHLCQLPTFHFQATDALSNALLTTVSILSADYDIVHFHGYASYYFVPILRRMGLKTVVTSHGLVDSEWENSKYNTFGLNIIRYAGLVGLKHADCVTVVAEYLKHKLKGTYNIDAVVAPSGIDLVSAEPPRLILNKYQLNKDKYILYLGRIDPIKRVDWLLEATGIIDPSLKIVISGGAQDSQTAAYLESLKRQSRCNFQVIFTGPVTGREKAELLSNCLLFVAPSKVEGLPLTVLEAMAYSKCCLGSDIEAHREIISDGVTGFLFTRDEKNQFIKRLAQLSETSKDVLQKVGAMAMCNAAKRFSWKRTTDIIEQVYWSLDA